MVHRYRGRHLLSGTFASHPIQEHELQTFTFSFLTLPILTPGEEIAIVALSLLTQLTIDLGY
jgi:hypothetical protein